MRGLGARVEARVNFYHAAAGARVALSLQNDYFAALRLIRIAV
jgi:hypothetical protein